MAEARRGALLGLRGWHELGVEGFDWWRQRKNMQGRWNSRVETWAGE